MNTYLQSESVNMQRLLHVFKEVNALTAAVLTDKQTPQFIQALHQLNCKCCFSEGTLQNHLSTPLPLLADMALALKFQTKKPTFDHLVEAIEHLQQAAANAQYTYLKTQAFNPSLKLKLAGIKKAYQDVQQCILQSIELFKGDEKVVLYLINHAATLTKIFGADLPKKFIAKSFPKGIEGVKKFLDERFKRRGFENLLEAIAAKCSDYKQLFANLS